MRAISCFAILTAVVMMTTAEGDRRISSGFIALKGKKNDIATEQEFAGGSNGCSGGGENCIAEENPEQDYFLIPEKRMTMGFQGVRGKKSDEPSPKRANMGFMGTRGKKYSLYPTSYDETADWSNLDNYWTELVKRKFYGTRGKKYLKYLSNVVDVRGKKGPSANAFFGMRGKKQDPSRNSEFNYYRTPEYLSTNLYWLNKLADRTNRYDDSNIDGLEFSDNEGLPYLESNVINE